MVSEKSMWNPLSLPISAITEALTPVEIEGRLVLVTRLDGEIIAFSGRCPHAGAELHEGGWRDGRVMCPMHAWKFDVRAGGICVWPPDERRALRFFSVRQEDEMLWLCLE